MTLLVCWLVFPLLLAAICLGCGLAVTRWSRTRVPATLLVPVGFAAVVVIGSFATLTPRTAPLTVPLFLAVAAVGLASSLPAVSSRVDVWAVGSALVVFAVFAAPVVLSGDATFAGYIKLDDTATFLALTDRAIEHGRSLEGLAPSSYEAALAFNLHFYPLGSLLPLSVGAVAWLLPALGVAAGTLVRRGEGEGRKPVVLGALVVGLVVPSLAVARTVLGGGVLGSLRNHDELGNLIAPLSPLQLAGIWPTGDFRLRPDDISATYVLLGVAVTAAVLGVGVAIARRAWEIALYAASAGLAALAFGVFGSPWLEAKALAIGSPVVVFAAVLGCAVVVGRGRRVEGLVALAAIALGVLWSNALAYREDNLAPRQQLAELEEIGERFAGTGPALMTEYQPYGVRHFLRRLDPEGASELRRRPVYLKDGTMVPKGGYADISAFRDDALLPYRTLVLRRSPVGSRPPAAFQLEWSGRFYEVWQRTSAIAGGALRCRKRSTVTPVRPSGGIPVVIPRAGRYDLWVGGSFRGELTTYVDGKRTGTARHQLDHAGQYTPLAQVSLAAGRHVVELRRRSPLLEPGSGGASWPLGPLAVSPAGRCDSAGA